MFINCPGVAKKCQIRIKSMAIVGSLSAVQLNNFIVPLYINYNLRNFCQYLAHHRRGGTITGSSGPVVDVKKHI